MKRRFLSIAMALLVLLTLLPTAALADGEDDYGGAIFNEELYGSNETVKTLAKNIDFYVVDAYGNPLGDTVEIPQDGSFFFGFKTVNIPFNNTYPDSIADIDSLDDLFWNGLWNYTEIEDYVDAGEGYNEEPSPENGGLGGIHIDPTATAGAEFDVIAYVCPKCAPTEGMPLPMNFALEYLNSSYILKKVIKVKVVEGSTEATAENGSASFAKPVPNGYSLNIAETAEESLADVAEISGMKSDIYAAKLTLEKEDANPYPVTKNDVTVTMDMPDSLKDSENFYISYVNPHLDELREGAVATKTAEGKLQFTTSHFSDFLIEGYNATIGDTRYADIDAAASAAQENAVIIMQADGTLIQSTNHVSGVTINRNSHTLKIAGGSHTFEVTTDDLAPHRVVASSEGVYTVSKDTHAVVFETNGGSTVAPSTVTCEELVGQPASPTRSGYVFQGWYTDSALTTQYDFTAPVTSDITLYAKWTQTSSGGGSTPSSPVPASSDEGSVNVSATVSGGTATISVSDSQLNQIASGNETDTGIVKLDLSSLKADKAVIPAKLVTATADATGSQGLEVAFSTASVALDKIALESVGNNRVTVSAKTVKATALTAAQAEMLGDQADTAVILDVNVLVNGVKTSAFGGGLITVRIPYTPKEGEDTSKLVVWYLKDDGTIEPMNGKYNESTKYFEFTTTHLSTYVLTAFPFSDVAPDSYYYGAAAWAVANGTTEGTTLTTFSPNVVCTRAQMAAFLWRAAGSPEPTTTENPFTDVTEDAYYYKAVLWAVEKGITLGTNDDGTTFSPNDTCTRGQMATFLYRCAGSPAVTGSNPFTDVATSDYYSDAVNWASDKGVTEGTNEAGTTFSPKDDCTRGQIVTFLYRYLGK